MNTGAETMIRVGLIGVGNWGRYGHVPVLQLLPNFAIAAISSRRSEYAQELASEFHIPHVFTDAEELIQHPEVDLVVVLPPAPRHAALVRSAISAGKDVYCEWPLTTQIADSDDLLARAQTAGVCHVVGLQRRLGPSARYVRDLLAQGYVGQIEGGKRNGSGLQIDITGTTGDLKVSNPLSFTNAADNLVEGSQGDDEPLRPLPIPEKYHWVPASTLDASVLDLAHVYAAYARDRISDTHDAPTFADAVKLHRLIDLISEASSGGMRQSIGFW